MTDKPETNISALSGSITSMFSNSRVVNAGAITENLPIGVMVCKAPSGAKIECLTINQFARTVFDLKEGFTLPCALDSIWVTHENQVLSHQIYEVYNSGTETDFEWNIKTGASERYLSSHLIPLRDQVGDIYQILCTIEDLTAERLAEKNLLHHAFHDALTGQPNRILFRNKLEEAVADQLRNNSGGDCAVLIINIDRFQQINESFGHSAGDRFLVLMAATLRKCIRGSDILARLSGDEFAILVSSFGHINEVEMVSKRIHKALHKPYNLDGHEVYTSVSIGIASTLSSSTHPEDLIRDADFAMHRAKLAGKSRTETYQRDTYRKAKSQFHLETELRRAVDRSELTLHFQPIVSIETSKIHSFEALSRWSHKERGFVSPAEFIPLAEETGVIVKLGAWAIDATCQYLRTWINSIGIKKMVPVNVNVSGIQFAREDVAEIVAAALTRHNVPGSLLRIELTESAIMANPGRISESLTKIRALGVRIALDDFGTGYSSLNYLHQFPIDIIKIDRIFINQLERGNKPYKILNMISLLAESLGHEVIAEGLERKEQIQMLQEMGFTYGQGYFYSPPVEAAKAYTLLNDPLPWGSNQLPLE